MFKKPPPKTSTAKPRQRKSNSIRADRAKGKFLKTWKEQNYNITKTMNTLGYSKASYNKWITTDQKFADMINNYVDKVVDDSLEVMVELAVGEKDFRAAKFLLETMGKERGFAPHNNTTINIKELPKIELIMPSQEDIENYHNNNTVKEEIERDEEDLDNEELS